MRDNGLRLAIEAAGGVGALARGLSISQPSVSGWTRVPADRVLAIESLTGVSRRELRPDLYAKGRMDKSDEIDEFDRARGQEFLLLATLLRRPPPAELLAEIGLLKGDASPLGMAHLRLAEAARATTEQAAGAEFFALFIGVGRGELMPYGSFYQTGFLYERPLARLREDLARLGLERQAGVHEPEDNIALLLEAYAGLVLGQFGAPAGEQEAFFMRHIKPWVGRFFSDLATADSARFYRAVGELGVVWTDIEAEAFGLPA
jgi:TorA maturation chaperone TorD/DNA-binding transcriptional regulator YdaS (Cro superfamily)